MNRYTVTWPHSADESRSVTMPAANARVAAWFVIFSLGIERLQAVQELRPHELYLVQLPDRAFEVHVKQVS